MNTIDVTDWDALVSRGTGAGRNHPSRWERESLYQRFDPLVGSRSPMRTAEVKANTLPLTPPDTTDSNRTASTVHCSDLDMLLEELQGEPESSLDQQESADVTSSSYKT
jgi:hypothetical protein